MIELAAAVTRRDAKEVPMATNQLGSALRRGDLAPSFTLPAIDRDGTVSLSDYRGKSAVLLGLFRGVYCPICRRKIAQMGLLRQKLLSFGVDSLAIVASNLEHARLYFGYQPVRVPLAADPKMTVLRAFGVPNPAVTPKLLATFRTTLVDPERELAAPVPITDIATTLNRLDNYEWDATDLSELKEQWRWDGTTQLMGRFLVDRAGIVQWVDIEGAGHGMAGIGQLATDDELFAAARSL
jgi:peroxiredoxin